MIIDKTCDAEDYGYMEQYKEEFIRFMVNWENIMPGRFMTTTVWISMYCSAPHIREFRSVWQRLWRSVSYTAKM